MRRHALATAFVLGSVSCGASARADLATPRGSAILVYDAPTACPGEEELKRAVGERLGYEPFHADSSKTIVVRLTAHGTRFRAHVEVRARGASLGERDLPDESDCGEVLRAVSLLVALAVDPLAAPAPPAAEPPPPTAAAPSEPPAPAALPPAPFALPAGESLRFHVLVGVAASLLRVPSIALGPVIQVGLGGGSWSLSLEGRAELPLGSAEGTRGSVSASLISAALVPCVEGPVLFGCAVVEAGALQGTGQDVTNAKRDTTPLIAGGFRAGVQLRAESRWLVRGHLDALAPVTRTTLSVNGEPVWTTPPVGLALVVSTGRRF